LVKSYQNIIILLIVVIKQITICWMNILIIINWLN